MLDSIFSSQNKQKVDETITRHPDILHRTWLFSHHTGVKQLYICDWDLHEYMNYVKIPLLAYTGCFTGQFLDVNTHTNAEKNDNLQPRTLLWINT